MAVHVAILSKQYLQMILDGSKTVESRLTKTARSPYRGIQPGQQIFFKCSSGPFMATATVKAVQFHDNLTPAKITTIHRRLNDRIGANLDYWQRKRHSRYATFITLGNVHPIAVGPTMPRSQGLAWFVINPPIIDAVITPGAIRNRYVCVNPKAFFPICPIDNGSTPLDQPICLCLPDGRQVTTDFVNGTTRLRWRGWARYFRQYQVQPGDTVRFVQLEAHLYGVCFIQPRS